jgi:hypothetical protein
VAVIAESLRAARSAARRLAEASRLRGPLTACTPASYLRQDGAPSRIVLCAPARAAQAESFLRACAQRLLWPAPPGDLHRAIDGIRAGAHGRPPKRVPSPSARRRLTSARLLEGRVDRRRASAALEAGRPFDWIVESPRHVRLTSRQLETLAERGVRWSALEPVELLAVFAPAAHARPRREWARVLGRRVPLWTGAGGRT